MKRYVFFYHHTIYIIILHCSKRDNRNLCIMCVYELYCPSLCPALCCVYVCMCVTEGDTSMGLRENLFISFLHKHSRVFVY